LAYEIETGQDLIKDCITSLSADISAVMGINGNIKRMDSLIFVVIAVVIISSFTLKILIIKFAKDIENLRKLGMRMNSASLFYFIHCTWILSATILVSFVFIRFFYSIYIVNNYFDWQLLLGISLIIFLAGSIYNAVSSILKIRFAGGKS
jgi:hypothetical protein